LRLSITPDNRPGAGGSLGLALLARAAPDGGTLAIGGAGAVAINPHTTEATGLEPVRQLAPIAKIADIPIVLVAGRASGLASLADVLARSRATPGGLSFGTTGTNSSQHLAVELLRGVTGANLVHIRYRGSAPAVTDVIAGTLPLASVDLTAAASHIAAGTLLPIVMLGGARSVLAPDIPTVAESGVPGFSATAWLGLFGPAGLPAPMVSRLSDEVGGVLAEPADRDRIVALAAEPAYLPADRFARFIADDSAQWGRVVASLRAGR
jgi:tripartite-type tricarboxylate transporter receptor subunit TctC